MLPEAVTAAWLSEVLGVDVSAVVHERIGDGLVGMNLRVTMEHDAPGTPSSVVVKLPSLDDTSRATGIALRNYEREVRFYLEVAHTVDVRVPHCFHGEWDAETGDFALVLEDMAPAVQGDQIAGTDPDTALHAVEELARLHGPRWDDPTLHDLDWLSRRTGADDAVQLEGLWRMVFPGFLDTYGGYLAADALALVERFSSEVGAWVEGRTGSWTVTHGDYRLDNLLFGTESVGPAVTVVDWQTPGHGTATGDLAYFCGAGLLPGDRRHHEHDLVDAYAAGLAEYGVETDRAELWEQYARDAFAGVVMAVVASQVVGGSDRSEAMFAAMATRHLQHALDLDSIDLVA
jgi:hypothetical protein